LWPTRIQKQRLLLELEKCEFVHGIKLMAYCLLYIQGKHNNNKYFWKWTNTKYWLPRTLQSLNYTMELQKKLWAKIFADEFKIIKIINYKVKKRKICDFLTYSFLLPVWLKFSYRSFRLDDTNSATKTATNDQNKLIKPTDRFQQKVTSVFAVFWTKMANWIFTYGHH
jgi:hypothetical protein